MHLSRNKISKHEKPYDCTAWKKRRDRTFRIKCVWAAHIQRHVANISPLFRRVHFSFCSSSSEPEVSEYKGETMPRLGNCRSCAWFIARLELVSVTFNLDADGGCWKMRVARLVASFNPLTDKRTKGLRAATITRTPFRLQTQSHQKIKKKRLLVVSPRFTKSPLFTKMWIFPYTLIVAHLIKAADNIDTNVIAIFRLCGSLYEFKLISLHYC